MIGEMRVQEVPQQAAASHSGAAAFRDDSFWDQRAPSPPSDFDPFAGRAGIATPPSALGMMTPGPPATAATPPKSPGNFLRGALQTYAADSWHLRRSYGQHSCIWEHE